MTVHYCNANGEEVFLSGVIHLQNVNDVMWEALMESEKTLMLRTSRIEGIYHEDTKTMKTGYRQEGGILQKPPKSSATPQKL